MTYKKSQVIQNSSYYPFGAMAETWTRIDTQPNQYLYNAGCELNSNTGNYEMFYREYDPLLGRMNGVDPMASKYASLTPYNYSFNDPVTLNDPSGADPYDPNYYRGNGNHGNHGYYYTDMLYNDGGFYHKYGREVTPYSFQSSLASILGNRTYSQLSGATSANMWAYSLYQAEQRQMNKSQVTANKDGITMTGSAAANFVSFLRLGGGITITRSIGGGKKGRDLVSISLVGLLVNNSSREFSDGQLEKIANGISKQISSSFTGIAKGLQWVTNAEIGINSSHNDPFIFSIVDDVHSVARRLGVTLEDGFVAFTSAGANITYMNSYGHNFSRTGAHEFGHALGLNELHKEIYHDLERGKIIRMGKDDYRGNLMHQSKTLNSKDESMSGTSIEYWQINLILLRNGLLGLFHTIHD